MQVRAAQSPVSAMSCDTRIPGPLRLGLRRHDPEFRPLKSPVQWGIAYPDLVHICKTCVPFRSAHGAAQPKNCHAVFQFLRYILHPSNPKSASGERRRRLTSDEWLRPSVVPRVASGAADFVPRVTRGSHPGQLLSAPRLGGGSLRSVLLYVHPHAKFRPAASILSRGR